jgi:hypothetical protein
MDRLHDTHLKQRPRRSHAHFAPLIWIAALLACWFVIGEWKMLPEMVSATMAALP